VKSRCSVYRARGRWRVQAPTREDGTRPSLGAYDTREEANRAARAYEQLVAEQPRGITVAGWFARWSRDRTARGSKKEASVFRAHIAPHPIADRLIKRVTRPDVIAWLRSLDDKKASRTVTRGRGEARTTSTVAMDRGLSWQTKKHALRLLVSLLEGALDAGHIPANPARGVRLPRQTSAHLDAQEHLEGVELGWTWLTAPEVAALLSVTGRDEHERKMLDAHRPLWSTAIHTGLRPGELYGLRWCDVRLDGAEPEVHVRRSRRGPAKTPKAVRKVPLLPAAVDALRAQLRVRAGIGEALVFPSPSGGCFVEGYQAGLRAWLRRAGITRPAVTMRSLRHTFASHMLQGTWTSRPLRLEELRDLMGHSSITVTQRYAHLSPGGIRTAFCTHPARTPVDGSTDSP
jgi:integrase